MNPILSFRKQNLRPILCRLHEMGEIDVAAGLRAWYDTQEDGFIKSRIASAVRVITADLRSGVNKMIRDQLKQKLDYTPPKNDDYYGVIEKAVRAAGVPKDDIDDLIQQVLAEMFLKGGKDFFTLFDPSREKDFSKFLYARAKWRARDYLSGRSEQLRTEKSISPVEDDEGHSSELVSESESIDDKLISRQYLETIDRELERVDKRRPDLRLQETWHHLLMGETKSEIAEKMGLRSPNITKRLIDLKSELLKIAKRHGWVDLAKMIIDQGTLANADKRDVA